MEFFLQEWKMITNGLLFSNYISTAYAITHLQHFRSHFTDLTVQYYRF